MSNPPPTTRALPSGAALYVQHQILNQPRSFQMRHVYWGPEYSDTEIRQL